MTFDYPIGSTIKPTINTDVECPDCGKSNLEVIHRSQESEGVYNLSLRCPMCRNKVYYQRAYNPELRPLKEGEKQIGIFIPMVCDVEQKPNSPVTIKCPCSSWWGYEKA